MIKGCPCEKELDSEVSRIRRKEGLTTFGTRRRDFGSGGTDSPTKTTVTVHGPIYASGALLCVLDWNHLRQRTQPRRRRGQRTRETVFLVPQTVPEPSCGELFRLSSRAPRASANMPPGLPSSKALYIVMEVVIALSSVVGNVMVVWAVRINRSLRDTTFCFIVSLALADIAVGALVIPLAITISIGLQTHFYSCLLVACTVLVLTQSSILALLAIAFDRYLRVKIPMR